MHAKLLQSCPTLCDPMDYNSPGSSVHGDSPGMNIGMCCHDLPDTGIETVSLTSPSIRDPSFIGF